MSVEKVGKKYRARVYMYGKQLHLGMYSTKGLAEEAVAHAQEELSPNKWLRPYPSLWDKIRNRIKRLFKG